MPLSLSLNSVGYPGEGSVTRMGRFWLSDMTLHFNAAPGRRRRRRDDPVHVSVRPDMLVEWTPRPSGRPMTSAAHGVRALSRLAFSSGMVRQETRLAARQPCGSRIATPASSNRVRTVVVAASYFSASRASDQPSRYSAAAAGTSAGRRPGGRVAIPRRHRCLLMVVRCTPYSCASSYVVAPRWKLATTASTSGPRS